MAIELSTPSFKPREYEGEYIRYALYGLDSDGDELDKLITSPKKSTVTHTIKELLPDYGRVYNGMHVVAILYDKNDRRLDSEVVWSTDQMESKGADETIEYEKGYKNSRGEDAPWVIRDHKGGKVLASFATKGEAEAHLERMKRYSKDEAAGSIVADNRLGKIVKARLRDNVLAFLPIDDDGKNDDCVYFFKVDGNNIITKGYHWGRDEIDRSMIADDGAPWTAEPNRPTRDWVHTEEYTKYLLDRVRKCLDMGVTTRKSEVADSVGFSRFVQNLLDAAINMFDDATWDRLVKAYDFGDDFEKGRSVADSLKNMQGWVLATEKRHTDEKLFNKDELERFAMNNYKAAVKAAWSAAGVKNFKIDHSDGSNKSLNVWPKTLDGNFYDVSWRIMPALGVVVQYADDKNGNSTIEREIPFKDTDDVEEIFTDEFKSLDAVIDDGKPAKTETAPDDYARDNFLEGALDYAEIKDDNGNVTLLKIAKRYANELGGDFCLRSYDGETDKSLAMGGIRYVVDRYGEFIDMDPAEAIIKIAKE